MIQFYKKLLLGAAILAGGLKAGAQVSVTATIGTTGPTAYTTLKAAFDAINAGTHSGSVTVNISGNTTETATANLNSGPYTNLTVNATAAATITGNISAALISFNGSRNVTINGNNNLQLVNNSQSGYVVRYANDATRVRLMQTKLKGANNQLDASSAINGAVVFFDAGSTAGNSNNSITGCDIDGGSTAICGILSKGDATSINTENFADSIMNCTIHDVLNNNVAASAGIFLSQGNIGWTISGNSIYNTTPFSTANQFVIAGIQIFPNFQGDAHEIVGNFIGGSAPNATGSMSLTGTSGVLGFQGMSIQTGGTGNMISNNTIKNISVTYSSSLGSFANLGIFAFIGGFNGSSSIIGNTISNFTVTNNGGSAFVYAIQVNGRVTSATDVSPTFNINNNTIDNITSVATPSPAAIPTTGDAAVYGIRLDVSSSAAATATGRVNANFNVSGNTITNMSVPGVGFASSLVRGIGTVATQGAGASGSLHPKPVITNNTISGLTTNSAIGTNTGNAQFASAVVTGIHIGGSAGATTNTVDTVKIRQNTIFNLSATNTRDSAVVATGILGTNGIYDISRNRIYDIRNANTGANKVPGIVGITVRALFGNSAIYDNFISLGNTVTTNVAIAGILQNFSNTGVTLNVYHNSVHIMGTAVSGARNTYGFYRGDPSAAGATVSTPVNIRNNIFQNVRTGGTGLHAAIGNAYTTSPNNWTSGYNDLYAANAANIAVWGTAANTLPAYATNASDATSVSSMVTFADVITGDLHLAGSSLTDPYLFGTPIASANTFLYAIDYDGAARSTTYPIKGADEVTITCASPTFSTQPADQTVCAGQNATFNAVSNAVGVTYQWFFGATAQANSNNTTFSVANVQAANTGSYSVRATNGCGTATSNTVTLSLKAATNITTQPVAQTVCAGQSATFTVAATGSGTVSYQWKKDGTTNVGTNSNTFTIPSTAVSDAGNYSVTVTGDCGAVNSTPVALTVNTGGSCSGSAVSNVSEEVSASVIMPSVVRNSATVRVTLRRAMTINWTITDAQGRSVRRFTQNVNAGQNDVHLSLSDLGAGSYQLTGFPAKGGKITLRFVKL